MIFCRVASDNGVAYGEGLNPKSALADAESNVDWAFGEGNNISFWEAEKLTAVTVEFEMKIVDRR